MKRLESAGFDPSEARTPSARKVDAEALAADKEARRKAGTDEKIRLQDILAGKVNTAREKLELFTNFNLHLARSPRCNALEAEAGRSVPVSTTPARIRTYSAR